MYLRPDTPPGKCDHGIRVRETAGIRRYDRSRLIHMGPELVCMLPCNVTPDVDRCLAVPLPHALNGRRRYQSRAAAWVG